METATGAEPLEFAEMVAYLKDHDLMVQKIPEQLEVVEALPRNNTLGKILKTDLRDHVPRQALEPGPTPLSAQAGGGAKRSAGRSTAKVPLRPSPAPARR